MEEQIQKTEIARKTHSYDGGKHKEVLVFPKEGVTQTIVDGKTIDVRDKDGKVIESKEEQPADAPPPPPKPGIPADSSQPKPGTEKETKAKETTPKSDSDKSTEKPAETKPQADAKIPLSPEQQKTIAALPEQDRNRLNEWLDKFSKGSFSSLGDYLPNGSKPLSNQAAGTLMNILQSKGIQSLFQPRQVGQMAITELLLGPNGSNDAIRISCQKEQGKDPVPKAEAVTVPPPPVAMERIKKGLDPIENPLKESDPVFKSRAESLQKMLLEPVKSSAQSEVKTNTAAPPPPPVGDIPPPPDAKPPKSDPPADAGKPDAKTVAKPTGADTSSGKPQQAPKTDALDKAQSKVNDKPKSGEQQISPEVTRQSLDACEKELNASFDALNKVLEDPPLHQKLFNPLAPQIKISGSEKLEQAIKAWNETDQALNVSDPNKKLSKADDHLKALEDCRQILSEMAQSLEEKNKPGGALAGLVNADKFKEFTKLITQSTNAINNTNKRLGEMRLQDALKSFTDKDRDFKTTEGKQAIEDFIERAPNGRTALNQLNGQIKDRYEIKNGKTGDSQQELIIHDKAYNRYTANIWVDKKLYHLKQSPRTVLENLLTLS